MLTEGADRPLIRSELGKPLEMGQTVTGRDYDIYVIKGKIAASEMEAAGHVQGIMLSFGVLEIICLPVSLIALPFQMRKVHELIVWYDDKDNYTGHRLFEPATED